MNGSSAGAPGPSAGVLGPPAGQGRACSVQAETGCSPEAAQRLPGRGREIHADPWSRLQPGRPVPMLVPGRRQAQGASWEMHGSPVGVFPSALTWSLIPPQCFPLSRSLSLSPSNCPPPASTPASRPRHKPSRGGWPSGRLPAVPWLKRRRALQLWSPIDSEVNPYVWGEGGNVLDGDTE